MNRPHATNEANGARISRQAYHLFFDGSCGICRRIVRMLGRFQKSARLFCIDTHDQISMANFPQIDRAKSSESVTLLEPDQTQRFGYAAASAVVGLIPKLKVLHWFMRLPGVRQLGDRVYHFISPHRHQISRWLGLG